MYYFIIFTLCFHTFLTASTTQMNSFNELSSSTPAQSKFESGYAITMPLGWKQVTDPELLKKRTLWSFGNYNDTAFVEHPVARAWDGPDEIDSFFTAVTVKRNCTLGLANFYDDIIDILKDGGAVIHEKGVIDLHGPRCKWWVQSFGKGAIHQHCFLFAHDSNLYTFYFTTTYLSEEKKQLFESIIKTVVFQ